MSQPTKYELAVNAMLEERIEKLERERNELRGAMARLCRAVSRRMMPDEPTPEDRLELMEAYEQAVGIIERTNQELTDDK